MSFNNLSAQIIYTDIIPDSTVSASDTEVTKSYYIDLDNNGSYEFELRHFNPGPGNEDVEIQQNFNSIQQVIIETNGHSKVLSHSDTINSKSIQWGSDGYGILNSPWYGSGDKYFGFRFKKSIAWYYGWARVNIPADHLSFTVKDYAYNSVPNAPINAGQTSTNGISNQSFDYDNLVTVFPNPFNNFASIHFSNQMNESYSITVYNSKGQIIQNINNISGEEVKLVNNNWMSGLYFFRLQNKDGENKMGRFIIY